VRRTLARDITAADLAVDSLDPDEGYPPDHIIGPKGSEVELVENWEDGLFSLEVTDFANDPFVIGFVRTQDLVPDDS
jgi:hypothetical protein